MVGVNSYEKYILIRKNVSKIKQKSYIEKELNLEKCFKLRGIMFGWLE